MARIENSCRRLHKALPCKCEDYVTDDVTLALFSYFSVTIVQSLKKHCTISQSAFSETSPERPTFSATAQRVHLRKAPILINLLIINDSELLRQGLLATIAAGEDINLVGDFVPDSNVIEGVKRLNPDLTLLGIGASPTDAASLCRQILTELPSSRVLVLSSAYTKEEELHFMVSGASGCLPANVSGTELVSAIRAVASDGIHFDPDVIELALSKLRQKAESERPAELENLTEREILILAMIGTGFTNREIGSRLKLATATVRNNITRIRAKLGIYARARLMKFALDNRLQIDSEDLAAD